MKARAQKHQLKMTAAGKPGRETEEPTLEDGKSRKKQQNLNMQGRILMWGMNNVKQIELDEA